MWVLNVCLNNTSTRLGGTRVVFSQTSFGVGRPCNSRRQNRPLWLDPPPPLFLFLPREKGLFSPRRKKLSVKKRSCPKNILRKPGEKKSTHCLRPPRRKKKGGENTGGAKPRVKISWRHLLEKVIKS